MEHKPKALAAVAGMAAFAAAVSADAAGEAARRAQANAQGLASEILSAEALNSLAESAPRLVRAVAEGLGITPGGLRQMADQGALTSEVLVVAFQKKAQDLQQEDRDRMAEIDAKAQAYGFSHDDVMRALDAAAMPKFAVGGMLPKDFVLGQVHTGEAIVPKACTGRIGGAVGGGCSVCSGGAFNPWPEALVLGREIVRLNERIARVLDRWDGDGVPAVRGQ